ncbi:hypothetical protein O979_20920 [Mycobacterium avium subsp. paratuberculosis 10-4404]|nr:hypothetical protein O979_20920 [Mycobacterium avium subsp. paratuberculosis 10-4404]ETA99726.1 hypothetical protein O978_20950 [Mycobacterium avium subsp. paratuberculosis 10-5864]ETB34959.1 hypothetical protein O975_22545 [Mycobacterium avium subsp. paratuberculosis 11-1786]ETB46973.1 hypothetical protein O976_22825 [Mycobacterium avium subsp. paratuberculosis 10-8425]
MASSGRVGIAANAAVYAVAITSWLAAISALFALACVNHARYGACAATYDSALGPPHAPAWADARTALSSSAVEAYSALNEFHAPAAASKEPGPGPLLSSAECTSGGEAIQIGAVIADRPPTCTTPRWQGLQAGAAKPSRKLLVFEIGADFMQVY